MANIDIVIITLSIITHAQTAITTIVIVTMYIANTDMAHNYKTHIATIVIVTIVILWKPSVTTK